MEKIRCSSCDRKYKQTASGSCPKCGQKASWAIDPTNVFIADLYSPDDTEESESNTTDRISGLEYEIDYLQSGLRSLAWGVVLIVLSMGTGVAMVTYGATEEISCSLSRATSCGGDGLVMTGWVVLAIGVLIGLGLALRATRWSKSYD